MEKTSDVRQYSKYTKNNEEHDLKKMPISIIRDLEQYKFSCPERIHGLIDSRISSERLRQNYNTPTVSRSLRGHKESSSTWSWY